MLGLRRLNSGEWNKPPVLTAAVKLICDRLGHVYGQTTLKEAVTIHNGKGLKKSDRSVDGPFDVYAAGGPAGKHSESLSTKPFVVIGRKGSAGKPTYAPNGGWVIDTAYFARPNDTTVLDTEFLYYALSCLDFGDDIIATAIPGINRTAVYKHRIPTPPMPLQRAVVEFLRALSSGKRHLPELPPPLSEQRRIVAKLDQLAAKIEEAVGLQSQVADKSDFLVRSTIFGCKTARRTRMDDLVKLRPVNVDVQPESEYEFAGVYCFGRGVFRGQKKMGTDFAYRKLTRLRAGDFVYPKLMAWEGAFAIVPPECDGLVVSTEFPVFDVDTSKVMPEVLDTYFRSPTVWPEVAGASTGTNVRRRRLNPKDFLKYEMPLPPMPVQRRIAAVKAAVDRIHSSHLESKPRVEALLPSVLDKAFRGEL